MFPFKNGTFFRRILLNTTKIVLRNNHHDVSRIRNIGLVAHIDAGKTTTTERILYYSGSTEQMGEVHDGDTVMDWMDQERERGITITSASATIQWNGHSINLIDTPGHVDFTFEVERSLSALDGAIVILDASSGVQAQTFKVWQQAASRQLSRLFFINKMDKHNANLDYTLDSIRKKLSVEPLLIHIPLYNDEKAFSGLIDILTGVAYSWPKNMNKSEHGKRFMVQYLLKNFNEFEPFLNDSQTAHYTDLLLCNRENLIGKLSELDEDFSEKMLDYDKLESLEAGHMVKALRSVTLQQTGFPTLIGSAYKKIGIQQLLNSVIQFLPDPSESKHSANIFKIFNDCPLISSNVSQIEKSKLCAYIFKNSYDKRLGPLSYVRLYSGTIRPGQAVHVLNRSRTEKLGKIYKPFANHFQEIARNQTAGQPAPDWPEVGDICVVSGLSSCRTGDTFVSSSEHDKGKTNDDLCVHISAPEPVFYCSIEVPSLSKMKSLEEALEQLQREDPSVQVTIDKNTNQIVLKGMGELHIDIIKDRIKREYGIEITSGPLNVSYLESISSSGRHAMESTKSIGGINNFVQIDIEIVPTDSQLILDNGTSKRKHKFRFGHSKEYSIQDHLKPHHAKWIQHGVDMALKYGPLSAFPVVNADIILHQFDTTFKTTESFITNIATQCVLEALRKSSPILLEPIMKLEISTPEEYFGSIVSDLSGRRTQFGDASSDINTGNRIQVAFVPLKELNKYSTVLRTISSGMASFEMILHSYRTLDEQQTRRALQSLTGIDC